MVSALGIFEMRTVTGFNAMVEVYRLALAPCLQNS
jgi:hypothetical protein